MLKDPKAKEFVENFAGQWLQTRNLKLASPDRGRFDKFDEPLRQAMAREVELFFAAVVHDDRPISDFLHADYTFLNERLAKHYGIAGVTGDKFRRVHLTDGIRGGVVTMASTLTVTSNPTRTSPVKRGKWILEEILGTPPPPPPPNVADLPDDDEDGNGKRKMPSKTLRARMEKHRADPNCASCHARMDPLGFGLENFDAIGAWRDKDGPFPVDASGTLPGGQTFAGPVELKAVLLTKIKPFARCLTEKLMTYALGRGLEYQDRCVVEKVADSVLADGGKFSTLGLRDRPQRPLPEEGRRRECLAMKPMSRRTILRGLGTAIALPWLEAMAPDRRRRPAPLPKRMAFFYVPNGVHMPDWTPKVPAEPASILPDILKPLDPFKDDLLVLTGLTQDGAFAHGDGGGDHARSLASFLTGTHPLKTAGLGIKAGVSVDQLAASRIGNATRFPSLELGIDRGAQAGNCDSGYSCAYSSNISWRSESTPMAKEINPQLVFERLFAGQLSNETAEAKARRAGVPQERPRLRPRGRQDSSEGSSARSTARRSTST